MSTLFLLLGEFLLAALSMRDSIGNIQHNLFTTPENRGMFPRVFGDEFGDKFGDEFGDKFSELPNLVIILVMNLVMNLVNCQIR